MMVNTGSTAGMVYTGAKGVLSNNAFRIRFDEAKVSRDFLFEFLTSPATQDCIHNFYNSAAQPHVGHKNIAQVPIGLPQIPEQRAIAGALSDVDALIGALDSALAKKRDLKQAAMQQLLTGQKRLPGFHGEWEVKRLGDVIELRKGQLITEKDAIPEGVPVIAGGKKPAYFHNKPNRTGKTITVSASGASAGYVAFFYTPIFASDCSTISEGQEYSIEFVYFQLQFKQEAIYKAQTGGAQPHIHPVDLMPLEIGVPTIAEQTAIAEVLSDMDAELAALTQRRDKTRALKQGMMQELLTGRVRLTKLKIENG
jgi:type I restriction enzyme S subunit